MKIEKLSDNQIRCTLTRADLAERQLNSANWLMVQKKRDHFSTI